MDATAIRSETIGDLCAVEPLDEQGEDSIAGPIEPTCNRIGELGDDEALERIDCLFIGDLERAAAPLIVLSLLVDPDRREPLPSLATEAGVGGDRRMLDDIGGVLLEIVEDRLSAIIETSI